MKFTSITIILLLLVAVSINAQAAELVRVRISSMDGSEPGTIDSSSYPALFVLDPRIASAELTYQNPCAPIKNNLGAATWMPALSPSCGGYIQLTITPVSGNPVTYATIICTTSARVASNPSSLRIMSSVDGFSSTLAVINLDLQRTTTTNLTTALSDSPFIFRWYAGNDFGNKGGGEAGFSSNDLVVYDVDPTPVTTVPTMTELGMIIFMVLAGTVSVAFLRGRQRPKSDKVIK